MKEKSRTKKALVFGGGGAREFCLADLFGRAGWHVYWYTGNMLHPGYLDVSNCQLADIKSDAKRDVIAFVKANGIDLVVIGPEKYLAAGYVDALEKAGIATFGPRRGPARLETDKLYCKQVLIAAGVPTAQYAHFSQHQLDEALAFVAANFDEDFCVIKATGLAEGKGVTVAKTLDEAKEAVRDCLERDKFGKAGHTILIEKKLLPAMGWQRAEFSMMVVTNGHNYEILPPAMDHKQVLDGDQGPNGGGSGVISNPDFVTPEVQEQFENQILVPFMVELQRRHLEFLGVLYFGLMLTDDGLQVLEINVRFGDPEWPALAGLHQYGLDRLIYAIASRMAYDVEVKFSNQQAVYIVMHAEGYPGKVTKGDEVTGIAEAKKLSGVTVIPSGLTFKDAGTALFINGGRAAGVRGVADTRQEACTCAYSGVGRIHWRGEHHRTDIGLIGCSN